MRYFGIRVTLSLLIPLLLIGSLVIPAGAQSLDDIADTVDRTGRYLDGQELEAVAVDAVDRAAAQNVGFVYLDQENGEDLLLIANGLLERLDGLGSAYDTLIVLDASGVFVVSTTNSAAAAAADAATPAFARGAIGGGIDTVLDVLGGGSETPPPVTESGGESAAESATSAEADSGSSSGGVPWLLILLLGGVVFLLVRFFLGRRRKAAALEAELAEDRAEIREQLRNNADHVIDLGERIADADDDLRRLYEAAAQTYQDVSMGLDDAVTPAEIDALDDRLDRAEWQFEVIEARLDGRTPPPEPSLGTGPKPPSDQPPPPNGPAPRQRPGDRQPVPPLGDDRPALGDDESIFPGPGRQRQPRASTRSGGGGMLGGAAKAGLLAMVMRVLFGGGLGVGNTSRRTQQRRTQQQSTRGGPTSGGLGRGVLR